MNLQPTTPEPTSRRSLAPGTPVGSAIMLGGVLAVMWLLEIIDQLTGNSLDELGIHSRSLEGLAEIFSAPFLHFGYDHLAGNSIPFLVLGWLALVNNAGRFVVTTLFITIISGMFAWLMSPSNAVTAGASGIIFGWLGYLLARGFFERKMLQILVAVGLLVVYGSMVFGLLPTNSGISWQGHLGGFLGGILAAWLLSRRAGKSDPSAQNGTSLPTITSP